MRAIVAVALVGLAGLASAARTSRYVHVPAGRFASVLPPDGKVAEASVSAFEVRVSPVTNQEMLAFVAGHPAWRRDRIASVFADEGYLAHWPAAARLAPGQAAQPVTHVSWFAAEAFCEAEGARLPTWHEWEYLAAADATRTDARRDPAWRDRILAWYARPSTAPLPAVGGAPDVYGARDVHGLVWEWVDDHASLAVDDDRMQGACGAGALSMQEKDNYAVLMRVAMLSSLKARDTTKNLGFRCVRDANRE